MLLRILLPLRAFASLTIAEAAFSDHERVGDDDERVAAFFIMSLAAFRKQNVFFVTLWRRQAITLSPPHPAQLFTC